MFHHGKDGKASFRSKVSPEPGARPAKPNGDSPLKKPVHGEPQAPHDAHQQEKHIKETHPGKTQAHPVTGVHAFHAHHTGGGQYTHHTHHDDGTVASREGQSEQDTKAAHDEAFPPEESAELEQDPMGNEGAEYAGDMAEGIGGSAA